MLRPSTVSFVAGFALALCAASPAIAQGGNLSEQLDAAEDQLHDDIEDCKPINMGTYDALLSQAQRNLDHAKEMAATSSLPIELEKLEADKKQAEKLRDRAARAAQNPCKNPGHGGGSTKPIEQQTKVEPPKLTPADQFKGQTSTATVYNSGPDYVGLFRAALARYIDAKKRCNGAGMMMARGEMDAAQGAAREILAKEKDLGGKSELLKQMAEQRQAAENGTISMCPALTPTLAHMLSEPPRVSSEPISEEEAAALAKAATSSPPAACVVNCVVPRLPSTAAAEIATLCSGPGLGDFGRSPAVPPTAVIPGSPGAEAAATLGHEAPADGERRESPSVGLNYTFKDSFTAGGYAHSADPVARPDEPRIRVGLSYEFAGHSLCPNYQETKVPQPELPGPEVFNSTHEDAPPPPP